MISPCTNDRSESLWGLLQIGLHMTNGEHRRACIGGKESYRTLSLLWRQSKSSNIRVLADKSGSNPLYSLYPRIFAVVLDKASSLLNSEGVGRVRFHGRLAPAILARLITGLQEDLA